jgi:hypothetical protein
MATQAHLQQLKGQLEDAHNYMNRDYEQKWTYTKQN